LLEATISSIRSTSAWPILSTRTPTSLASRASSSEEGADVLSASLSFGF
jgi:hypothetical protein